MIKSILHKDWHQIQTRFSILDYLCLTEELNIILFIDQKYYKADFLEAPSKSIFLHAIARKIITSNKVAISCNCKKSCITQSEYKNQKNNIKCL